MHVPCVKGDCYYGWVGIGMRWVCVEGGSVIGVEWASLVVLLRGVADVLGG